MALYEETYKDERHFSFGKNWRDFLQTLNDEKISEAEKSLEEYLGGRENIQGKTFVDIGSGSGLFSLAAFRLGAAKIVSVDIDESSVECTRVLREKYGDSSKWQVLKGSALDSNFIKTLGQFDIVYSWGVLHHTGKMYKALENIIALGNVGSFFYIALYNKYEMKWRGGTWSTWLLIKERYNSVSQLGKNIMFGIYYSYSLIMMLIRFQNPKKVIAQYKSFRGMSWKHDLYDWIGGFPYEASSVDEIINFFGKQNIYCKKVTSVDGLGCNEFLMVKAS